MSVKNIYYLIILLGLPAILWQSCNAKHPAANSGVPLFDSAKVQRIVNHGKVIQNTYTDSLIPVFTSLNKTPGKVALVYCNYFESVFYWHEGNHQRAMEFALKSLGDAERLKVKSAFADIYLLMGNLNKEKGNYQMAFKDADTALKEAKENKDTSVMISAMGNKAMFTRSYYLNINQPKADHQSLTMQLAGLKMAQTNPKYERVSIKFYTNIAQFYKDQGDLSKTLLYGFKGVELANKYGQKRSLTYAYCWIGEAYYRNGQHAKGIDYLNKALQETREIREPYREMEIYETIYSCYLLTGDYKQAIFFSDKSRRLHDSLQVSSNLKQLGDLQLKYESVKKDKEIMALANEDEVKSQELLWVMISSILFIVLFISVLAMYYTIRKQHRLITEKNAILNDALNKIAFVQSHEMRKPLASILGLINVIRADDYQVEKECWNNLEQSSKELDEKIRSVINQTEVNLPVKT